jgi:hypothetical protein
LEAELNYEEFYAQFARRSNQLFGLVKAMSDATLFQGEHQFTYVSPDGEAMQVRVHVEGTALEMCQVTTEPGDLTMHVEADHE